MYHIRRADNFEEKSLYAGTLAGFEAASIEAGFRTYHTGIPHEVYDDIKDKVVNKFLPSAHPEKVSYSSAFGITKSLTSTNVKQIMTGMGLVIATQAMIILILIAMFTTRHLH